MAARSVHLPSASWRHGWFGVNILAGAGARGPVERRAVMSHLTYAEAIIVGLIQGTTELFPVSSLGHNVLIPALIGGGWKSDLNVAKPESPYLVINGVILFLGERFRPRKSKEADEQVLADREAEPELVGAGRVGGGAHSSGQRAVRQQE